MNAYQERFKQHPLQGSLDALQTAIERVRLANQSVEDGTVFAESNEVQRAAFARLFRVARFISSSITRCNASIWTPIAMSAAQWKRREEQFMEMVKTLGAAVKK